MNVPLPRGMGFYDWVCQLINNNGSGLVPEPPPEAQWKTWANALILNLQLDGAVFPESFDSWTEWAERMVPILDEVADS